MENLFCYEELEVVEAMGATAEAIGKAVGVIVAAIVAVLKG